MDVLPYNFFTCRLCGMWFESEKCCFIKTLYRLAVLMVILQFTLGQIIALAQIRGSLDEFVEVLFLSLTFAALCLKVLNFLRRKSEMLQLLRDFRSDVCLPKSQEERNIEERCSINATRIFLAIMSLSQSTGLVLLVIPFLGAEEAQYSLPFKSYQPYRASEGVGFWCAYVLQILAAVYGVLLNVSMDTMVYGFIIKSTAQFEIICDRLANSTVELTDCVKHHVLIQDIVSKIQHFFIRVIVPLFFFSLVTLCTSIFQMSQKQIASFEFLSLIMYLACMLCQVFLYCWFGNELELKSRAVMDAIYLSKWVDYKNRDKKSIWFIMLNACRGSSISFHGQCGLSLSTFLWLKTLYDFISEIYYITHVAWTLATNYKIFAYFLIVKTSYAAFNLLQQASI